MICMLLDYYQLYQLGTGGRTQKAGIRRCSVGKSVIEVIECVRLVDDVNVGTW